MDFSFVNNKPATKRTEPVSDIPATSQQAAGASQPGSRQSAPAASSTTTNRPVIQLPSLPEVQAAQRPRAPPNLFRPAAATQPPTAPGNASSASASAAPTQRPAALPAATFSLSPAATLRAAQPQQPSSSGGSFASGTGVFSPESRTRPEQQSASQQQGAPAQAAAPSTSTQQYGSSQPRPVPAYSAYQATTSSAARQQPAPQRPAAANSAIQAAAFQQVNPNAILVNNRQEGNPLLRHIRNVRWQYADIVPDYQLGNSTCALFLSLRFHLLKPEYIHHRIRELQRSFRLRVLLCHVDVEDVVRPLEQVTKAALLNDCTLICAWSPEECARYLETYKAYETKPADSIQGRTDEDYFSRLNAAFTTVRGVNKTDVLTLASTFKSAGGIMQASMEELAACPGIGPTKVRRLYETFHEPFRKTLPVHRPPEAGTASGSQAAASGAGAVGSPSQGGGAGSEAAAGAAGVQASANGIAETLLVNDDTAAEDAIEDDDFGLD